ncbi:MAG TPA: DegT/DnrJ/EryC1/StrS family aminotransferase [Acidimicrobiales bacterium]|nr:DegT/DnrJ/EryC1/StrS family aminotransferase [Acidimicrobiales bacterium]
MRSSLPAVLGGLPAFPDGLPLVRPWVPDIPGIGRRIEAVLASGRLTVGPLVRELEDTVAEYLGVEHVVAVASCTSGLMLVLQALGATGPVVLPSFTFSASAHAVVWAGGSPVFADIEPESLTLDPEAAAAAAAGAVAVMATHVFGTPCAVERLQAVADEAGLPLVYDAAHALGSRRRGRPIGGFGAAEVFSLSPTKVVVAGEGGLVATNDAALAEACRLGRDYGNPGDYDCRFPGLNARMSELHAAVALASFAQLDERVAHRNALVETFKAATARLPGLSFPSVDDADVSTYKDLTLLVDGPAFGLTAEELGQALRAEGIDCRRYYVPPVHRQRAYAGLAAADPLPVTERVADQVLTPPLWSHMKGETVRQVAEAVVRLQQRSVDVQKLLAQDAEVLGG